MTRLVDLEHRLIAKFEALRLNGRCSPQYEYGSSGVLLEPLGVCEQILFGLG